MQMNIGIKIKELRKQRGISQQELGSRLGVSGSMIGQYENGVRNPKSDTIYKIADALEVSITELLGTSDEKLVPLFLRGIEVNQCEKKFLSDHEIDEDKFSAFRNYLQSLNITMYIHDEEDIVTIWESQSTVIDGKFTQKKSLQHDFKPDELIELMDKGKAITKALIFGNK